MPFDVDAAHKAGYSDDDILTHLTDTRKFDVAGALKAGYSKQDIISHLSSTAAPTQPPQEPDSLLTGIGKGIKGIFTGARDLGNQITESMQSPAAKVAGPGGGVLDLAWKYLKGTAEAQADQLEKSRQDFNRGSYLDGVRHALGYLIPLGGPEFLGRLGDKAASGKPLEASGEALVEGASMAAPGSPLVKDLKIAVKPKVNAVTQRAVDFADRAGIPVPLSVRTGGQFARGLEAFSERDLGGSQYAANARQATTENLQRVGDELAGQVHPSPVNPEEAGGAVVGSLKNKITNFDRLADKEYAGFRDAEKNPANVQQVKAGVDPSGKPITTPMAMPVDMRPVKNALKDVYDRYRYTMPIADQRASRGLKALDNIINGPDFKPATAAEIDLGAVKEAARAEMPELRDTSQGLAAGAVKELDQAIRASVAGAKPGPSGANPVQSLMRGRGYTAEKFDVADVLKSFGRKIDDLEPVQVYRALTWEKDAGIERLREVGQRAPDQMPKIGRAFVEGLLDDATRGGDFAKTQTLLNRWEALGPETKKVLFRNPGLIQDLDSFFRLAQKTAIQPNPSGTALTSAIGSHVVTFAAGVGGMFVVPPATATAGMMGTEAAHIIGNAALSRLLFNPQFSRALVRGMTVPVKSAAGAAAASQLLKLAGNDAQPVQSQ